MNDTEMMIKEVIVVEGRDDIAAINRAVRADTIATHGYGISAATYSRIENAAKTRGIIIFTDPDHAGQEIRKKLTDRFPDAIQAHLTRQEALKDGDIGIENASPEDIRRALERAGHMVRECAAAFTESDMDYYGFAGGAGAAELRGKVGRALGIGYGNSRAFLKKLNSYGITREEVESLLQKFQ